MLWQEKKQSTGYTYFNEDYYGTLKIESPERLEAGTLDTFVLQLMNKPSHTGEVQNITYTLTRTSPWEEDDEQ